MTYVIFSSLVDKLFFFIFHFSSKKLSSNSFNQNSSTMPSFSSTRRITRNGLLNKRILNQKLISKKRLNQKLKNQNFYSTIGSMKQKISLLKELIALKKSGSITQYVVVKFDESNNIKIIPHLIQPLSQTTVVHDSQAPLEIGQEIFVTVKKNDSGEYINAYVNWKAAMLCLGWWHNRRTRQTPQNKTISDRKGETKSIFCCRIEDPSNESYSQVVVLKEEPAPSTNEFFFIDLNVDPDTLTAPPSPDVPELPNGFFFIDPNVDTDTPSAPAAPDVHELPNGNFFIDLNVDPDAREFPHPGCITCVNSGNEDGKPVSLIVDSNCKQLGDLTMYDEEVCFIVDPITN